MHTRDELSEREIITKLHTLTANRLLHDMESAFGKHPSHRIEYNLFFFTFHSNHSKWKDLLNTCNDFENTRVICLDM